MALMQCPECNQNVSDTAKICPHCGFKLKPTLSKKAKRIVIIVVIALLFLIAGAVLFYLLKPCEHQWQAATCEKTAICELCEETSGEALEHEWENENCTSAKICKICNATEGKALGHNWTDATCTVAKTCSRCKISDGDPLGHQWAEATYTAPKTCSVCNATEGNALTKPKPVVPGIYQLSYFKDGQTVTESLYFNSGGSVTHVCNTNSSDGYGSWSVSGSTISFSLYWEGADHTDYETATIVNGGIMWGSSFWKKIG